MKIKRLALPTAVLAGVALILAVCPGCGGAAGFEAWIPLLPQKLGGLEASGPPEGMTMVMDGETWSSLHQIYNDHETRTVEVTVIYGSGAPEIQSFRTLPRAPVEDAVSSIRPVEISGYKGLLHRQKNGNIGTLMLPLGPVMLIVIEAEPVGADTALTDIARELPLDRLAALE